MEESIMMNAPESHGFSRQHRPSVTVISGNEPVEGHVRATQQVSLGGNGLDLIGALPVLADAGSPTRVPRPGVEEFVSTLAAAIQMALAEGLSSDANTSAVPIQENATLLFTDVVGWTPLTTRVPPEIADEIRHRHFFTLHQAIGAAGGTAVKSLGDGAMAAFSTASAALSCAVAMQRGVDNDNRAGGYPLGLRVGVSGGEVTREGADYFGDPVIEAARLCGYATGGKIIVAQVVKEMAGRHAPYPYRALGRLELKGLPVPLEAFEVTWDPGPGRLTPGTVISRHLDRVARHPS
jgi:class 3 adenylate cyclase